MRRPEPKPHPFGKSLIINGNVEGADFGEPAPEGWVAWRNDRKDRVGVCDWEGRVQRNQNLWRSGRRSLKLMWAPKRGLEWRQTWPAALFVEPGHRYRAAVWLKTVDATGKSGVALQFARRNAEAVTIVESKSVDGTSDWVQLAVEAAVPAGAERLRVILFSRENEGAVWCDDVELVRLDPNAIRRPRRGSPQRAGRAVGVVAVDVGDERGVEARVAGFQRDAGADHGRAVGQGDPPGDRIVRVLAGEPDVAPDHHHHQRQLSLLFR